MNPYLSIVFGMGGNLTTDLLARFSKSTAVTVALAEECGVPCEIVVVLWNAPSAQFKEMSPISLACPIRIIQTGNLHQRTPNPHGFKYFEWYPKNIGIRRARGEFVLSTNPDDLFPIELFRFFARRELQQGHFYRVNRHDTRDGQVFAVVHPTGPRAPGASQAEIRRHIYPRACPWSENMLHYSAAGDFTLMSRDDWFMIRGNPEREYNDSVDGQTLWLAHTKGMKQVVLPYKILHPDHPRTLNHAYVPEWNDNAPHTKMNGEDWGFAGMEFPETIL